LAFEHNELAGDEKFFDLLDETLADPSQGATERLSVFYTCIGLGFTGWYTGQPEFLRKKQMEIAARIRSMMEVDEASRICPEAYENVDTSDLIQPPGAKLMWISVCLIGMAVVIVVADFFLFRTTASDLLAAIQKINDHEATAPTAALVVPGGPTTKDSSK
jgi:type VI protein secretion system component VasF